MSNKTRSKLAWGLVFTLIPALPAFAQIQTARHAVDSSFDGGFWIQTVDFDQDGDLDLVAASLREGLKWYENNAKTCSSGIILIINVNEINIYGAYPC